MTNLTDEQKVVAETFLKKWMQKACATCGGTGYDIGGLGQLPDYPAAERVLLMLEVYCKQCGTIVLFKATTVGVVPPATD